MASNSRRLCATFALLFLGAGAKGLSLSRRAGLHRRCGVQGYSARDVVLQAERSSRQERREAKRPGSLLDEVFASVKSAVRKPAASVSGKARTCRAAWPAEEGSEKAPKAPKIVEMGEAAKAQNKDKLGAVTISLGPAAAASAPEEPAPDASAPGKEVAAIAVTPPRAKPWLPWMLALYSVAATALSLRAATEVWNVGRAAHILDSTVMPTELALAFFRSAACCLGLALLFALDFMPNAIQQVRRLDALTPSRQREPDVRNFALWVRFKMFGELAAAGVAAFLGRIYAGGIAMLAVHFAFFAGAKTFMNAEGQLLPFPSAMRKLLVGLDVILLGLLVLAGSTSLIQVRVHSAASFAFLSISVAAVWSRLSRIRRSKAKPPANTA